jgi:hypothetical protein
MVRSLVVGRTTRATVAIHEVEAGVGRGRAVSARVRSTNGVGVVVERPIYFRYGDGITGGHTVLGALAPRQSWLFAEGYTGLGFDTFLTILNPQPVDAPLTVTYFLAGDQPPRVHQRVAPASSRLTIAVHDPNDGVGRDQAVSMLVESAVPGGIVVERPSYFRYGPAGAMTGGHTGWVRRLRGWPGTSPMAAPSPASTPI